MKNIVLIDKSLFQTRYVWQENSDLLSYINNAVSSVTANYRAVDCIVCYLDRTEFDSFRNSLGKDFVMWSAMCKLPAELTPMCKRWIQYGGVYFMEVA